MFSKKQTTHIMKISEFLSASAIILGALLTCRAQEVHIDSLASNGRMTWSAPTGSVCRVEWAASLGSNAVWRQDWLSLQGIATKSSNTTVEVPMFYRVSCVTNFFFPLPVNRQFAYRFQEGSQVSTQIFWFGGRLTMPWTSNEYAAFRGSSSSTIGLGFVRSTSDTLYEIWHGVEQPLFRLAPVGTVWTIEKGRSALVQVTIETNEVVSMPAGTFSALKHRREVVQADCFYELGDVWYEWISPGLGMVKFSDPSESGGPGETAELLYMTDQ